jgi:hypothetical protein
VSARIRLVTGKAPAIEGVKKCSLFDVQLSSVIFGGAFGAASLTKHCAKRHHRCHMNIEHRTVLSDTFENDGFYCGKSMILGGTQNRTPLKSVTHSFPSFPRRGGALAPGWLSKSRSFLLDAAKPPLFNAVRFANICAVAARLYKPTRPLARTPLLGKEGNGAANRKMTQTCRTLMNIEQ